MNHKKDPFEYLNSLGLHTVKPGLERIAGILDAEQNPHLDANTVLIAGTNGKSSTASMLASVLTWVGFSTGLYTSPHLTRPEERIKTDGAEISSAALGDLINRARRAAEAQNLKPSYFEILTAAAFMHFRDKGVDFAVLEAGMGGRWDATNVARPLVSAITNVSMDHVRHLGNTEEKIADEKSGIVKRGIPLITGAKGAALGVIEKTCLGKESPILRDGTEFRRREKENGTFSYVGPRWKIENICSGMKGEFQKTNACIALACAESLSDSGVEIPPERAKAAIEQMRVEARMEYICHNPPFIIDGAHNPAAALCLAESLEKIHGEIRFVFVVAMSNDKDHALFLRRIAGKSSRLILTRTGDGKSAEPERLMKFAPQNTAAEIAATPEDALRKALKSALPCCVTGSLYFAGQVKKLISKPGFSIKI